MIELALLGRPVVRVDGDAVPNIERHRQKVALLAYLGVEGPMARERLLELLWPDQDEERGRHSLSQALYSLRQELGDDVVTGSGAQVALAPDSEVDVKRIEAAAQAGDHEQVIELYRGPFLEHFHLSQAHGFEEWQSRTRAWVGGLARTAYGHVIAGRYAAGDPSGALDAALRWVAQEPLEDEAQHALIALLALAGDRSRALDQYEAYRGRLERDLEVEPLQETVAMVERIRGGESPGSPLLRDAAAGAPSPDGAAPLPVPGDIESQLALTLAPDIELVRRIGDSPSASLYLAREPALGRLLTVKVLLPKLASNRRTRRRFEREMLAVASLTHANVVALHWSGRLPSGLPFFVLQHVEGISLGDKLALEGPLPVRDARSVLAQVAAALDAAHRRGIVHRGVQPATVLAEEKTGRVLLSDFGTATVLEADPGGTAITLTGETIGDPAWMSPEQLAGEEVTPRSDVYNLGLLGYKLLTEESPYGLAPGQGRHAAYREQAPRPLRDLRPDVDADVADLLERCLDREPQRRPSASRVRDALGPAPEPAPGPAPTSASASASVPAPAWLQPLRRLRGLRASHWFIGYLAAGFGVLALTALAADRGLLAGWVLDAALITYLVGAPVVAVLAWYHRGNAARE